MAVARGQAPGGISAIHVWLIVFVALWLAATVLLVILYLDQEEKDKQVAELRDREQKLISAQGRKLPQFTAASPGKSTMVDLLEEARAETAMLAVGGDGSDDTEAVRARLNAQVDRIRQSPHAADTTTYDPASFDEALELLFELYEAAADAQNFAEQRANELAVQLEELRQAQERQKQQFDEETERVKEQVVRIEEERAASRQAHAQQINQFEEQLRRINEQCSENIQTLRSEQAGLQVEYDDLLARYQELKDKLGMAQISPAPRATLRQGDGRVVKATPGDEVVYIDLGLQHNVTPGLQFAVYDALTGIPESGRAKARIEVVRRHPKTSECRIVEMFGNDIITADDIIANPIYDRARKLRFYVLGSFDLDGDADPDPGSGRRIMALVEDWGGTVEDELSAQVDFVVLGGPPPLLPRSPDLDPEEDTRYQTSRRAYEAYQERKNAVRSMSIPTLTQSVFLNFLGFTANESDTGEPQFGR
jgi:hypothetical protein